MAGERTIYVIGAGKGLGNAVARVFGRHDFQVVLMARKQQHLAQYQQEFTAQNIKVATQVVDVSDLETIGKAYQAVKSRVGSPDVLFYNVGMTQPDDDNLTSQQLLHHYQTDVVGAYQFIQDAMQDLDFISKQGSILLTGGGLAFHPSEKFLPLSMDKAALRAMVLSLAPKLKRQNINIGVVNVSGAIGQSTKYQPDKIAEQYWQMYQEQHYPEITY